MVNRRPYTRENNHQTTPTRNEFCYDESIGKRVHLVRRKENFTPAPLHNDEGKSYSSGFVHPLYRSAIYNVGKHETLSRHPCLDNKRCRVVWILVGECQVEFEKIQFIAKGGDHFYVPPGEPLTLYNGPRPRAVCRLLVISFPLKKKYHHLHHKKKK